MNSKTFNNAHTEWIDNFIEVHDRSPESYTEFVQHVMDALVDSGQV